MLNYIETNKIGLEILGRQAIRPCCKLHEGKTPAANPSQWGLGSVHRSSRSPSHPKTVLLSEAASNSLGATGHFGCVMLVDAMGSDFDFHPVPVQLCRCRPPPHTRKASLEPALLLTMAPATMNVRETQDPSSNCMCRQVERLKSQLLENQCQIKMASVAISGLLCFGVGGCPSSNFPRFGKNPPSCSIVPKLREFIFLSICSAAQVYRPMSVFCPEISVLQHFSCFPWRHGFVLPLLQHGACQLLAGPGAVAGWYPVLGASAMEKHIICTILVAKNI